MLVAKESRNEAGQSLVELALSFIILIILLLGAVDLGRAFFALITIRDAAQEGAVYGSLHPTDTNGIIQRVRTSSDAPIDMSDANRVHVTINVIGAACEGNSIQVTVTYDFQFVTPFVNFIRADPFPLTATMINTILQPHC